MKDDSFLENMILFNLFIYQNLKRITTQFSIEIQNKKFIFYLLKMSDYDRLVKEFSSRKFNSEELRFLIEKFKVRTPLSLSKKVLAQTLVSLLLERDLKSPNKKNVNRKRGDDRYGPIELKGDYIRKQNPNAPSSSVVLGAIAESELHGSYEAGFNKGKKCYISCDDLKTCSNLYPGQDPQINSCVEGYKDGRKARKFSLKL